MRVNHRQAPPRPLFFLFNISFTSQQTHPSTLLPKRSEQAQPGMKSSGISLDLSVPHIPEINNHDERFCFPKHFCLHFRESKPKEESGVFFVLRTPLIPTLNYRPWPQRSKNKTKKNTFLHIIVKGSLTERRQLDFLSFKHSSQKTFAIVTNN